MCMLLPFLILLSRFCRQQMMKYQTLTDASVDSTTQTNMWIQNRRRKRKRYLIKQNALTKVL